MNLYQLSEPEKQQELILGIDLGTTNSLVAKATPQGITLVENRKGQILIPSVVAYTDTGVLIGEEAVRQGNAIHSIKRQIALYTSKNKQELNAGEKRNKETALHQAIENSAAILSYLKELAQTELSKPRIVLTVPAHFNEHARNATRKAAEIAGLEVVRLLNEPTAAAIAYNLNIRKTGNFLVYDLGGGTFDISILKVYDGMLKVIATAGHNHLGGDDFDLLLATELFARPLEFITKDERLFAKRVKEYLTYNEKWAFKPSSERESEKIMKPALNSYTIDQAEELWQPLVAKTLDIMQKTIKKSQLDSINEVILVGGASRLPLIKRSLQKTFPALTLLDTIDPDKVVAIGAGMQARALLGYSDHLLLDIVPMSLCIETLEEGVEIIIPCNTPIPAVVGKMFTNSIDGQTKFKLHILQGEGPKIKDCVSLGIFELNGITPMAAGSTRLEITFIVDANGLLNVKAQEEISDIRKDIDIKRLEI